MAQLQQFPESSIPLKQHLLSKTSVYFGLSVIITSGYNLLEIRYHREFLILIFDIFSEKTEKDDIIKMTSISDAAKFHI